MAGQAPQHDLWWYPKRCELPGCEARGEGLRKCAACSMVSYCCKEHQAQDRPVHKKECAVFRRLGLSAKLYNDEQMLERFPLGSALGHNTPSSAARPDAIPAGACCGLCGKTSAEETLGRAPCCGEVVCDNELRYRPGTFSRDFCLRSHARYTLCGHHGVERECARGLDWRVCPGCATAPAASSGASTTSDRLWRGLNAYNVCPLLERDVPRHALCDRCPGCGRLYIQGVEGCMYKGGQAYCLSPGCSGLAGFPRDRVFRVDDAAVSGGGVGV
ncbi:hypothetical protein GPECTOR_112g275 [Gonium pectorale]|uniref:MYND-type domain-containing protein n=1 Tax=Gonium pectorale TaxID=33097 RepID=A0A150G0C3_GONPE|nr:hypothetical protein GPECTOR_112g275 [Gonium pectorale]|eukprot:KXZ42905.1 hypothetical protein GPECTOR_112g275 [Gonium pectorale]